MRCEPLPLRYLRKCRPQLVRYGFVDATALLADHEDHQVARRVVEGTRDEGVAAFQAVNEGVLDQELQGAIDRDRSVALLTALAERIDEIICAHRTVRGVERFQHLLPDRRQPQAASDAPGLRFRDGGGRAG